MTQEEFENIENYLRGELSGNSVEQFEQKMKRDPLFKKQVEDLSLQIQAIEEVSFREGLDKMHVNIANDRTEKNSIKKSGVMVNFQWKKLMVAASIALLLGVAWLILQKPNHERLYAENFKPNPGLVTPMSATEHYDFFRGMVDYKQGEYKLAADRWVELLKTKPKNDTLLFYLGVTNMALENNSAALVYLKQMPKDGQSVFSSDSFYYLGLSELKEGNIELARDYLIKSNSQKAKKLIEKIN